MAATTAGRQLTEAHRLAQSRLGAETATQMLAAFRLLDPTNLDQSLAQWLRIAVPLIQRQHVVSADVAANYVRTFRALEVGAAFPPVIAPPVVVEAVVTSLTVVGPVSIKQAMTRGSTLERAVEVASANVAKAAIRHVLDGSRTTIIDTVDNDPRSLGWARATSGKTCAFCAMLASRGFVYKGKDTANFEPHDGCNCQPEPSYVEGAMLPPGSDRYQQIWNDVAKGSDDPINAFRRALGEAAPVGV